MLTFRDATKKLAGLKNLLARPVFTRSFDGCPACVIIDPAIDNIEKRLFVGNVFPENLEGTEFVVPNTVSILFDTEDDWPHCRNALLLELANRLFEENTKDLATTEEKLKFADILDEIDEWLGIGQSWVPNYDSRKLPSNLSVWTAYLQDVRLIKTALLLQGKVPPIVELLFQVYSAGGLPCGWLGPYPEGLLIVYCDPEDVRFQNDVSFHSFVVGEPPENYQFGTLDTVSPITSEHSSPGGTEFSGLNMAFAEERLRPLMELFESLPLISKVTSPLSRKCVVGTGVNLEHLLPPSGKKVPSCFDGFYRPPGILPGSLPDAVHRWHLIREKVGGQINSAVLEENLPHFEDVFEFSTTIFAEISKYVILAMPDIDYFVDHVKEAQGNEYVWDSFYSDMLFIQKSLMLRDGAHPLGELVLSVYLSGGIPCGWLGQYPEGYIIVFWPYKDDPGFDIN